jgi:hypothetical protein
MTFRQQIANFLGANPGFICSECIASALVLPIQQVAIATIGLIRLQGFDSSPRYPCSRCGAQTRVIREHAAPLR